MLRPSIKKRKWLYKTVIVLATTMAQITSAAAQPPMTERRLTKSLLNERWKEFARIERAAAFLDMKNKKSELKDKAGECQKMLKSLFMDGKVYYDSQFYKEAIATWYEVLLLSPDCKSERDDKKAELLIINTQKALKNYTEAKIRRHKDQADIERHLARSSFERAKRNLLNANE